MRARVLTNLVWQGGVTDVTLSVVTSRLLAVLHPVSHPAGHLLRRNGHLGIADHVLKGWYAAKSLAVVFSGVLPQLIAGAVFVEIILETETQCRVRYKMGRKINKIIAFSFLLFEEEEVMINIFQCTHEHLAPSQLTVLITIN